MGVADRSSLPRRPPSRWAERQPLPRDVAVLPELPADFEATLSAGLAALAVDVPVRVRQALEAHVRLLLAWNEHMNLSGLREPVDIARGHVLDALLAVRALRGLLGTRRDATLLDLGSGGGFPGLPLALMLPVHRVALVDSIAKKAAFLEAAANAVLEQLRDAADPPAPPPEIVALPERAEDLADEPDHREGWDLVTARAVGTIAEVAELGLPLTRRGGHVVVWKRATDDAQRRQLNDELNRAQRIVQAAGGARPRVTPLAGAGDVGLDGNCLVVIRKVRTTPDRYPRTARERRRTALP